VVKGTAICDGRGNARTGARASVLLLEDGREIEKAEKIEAATNIVAEHLAIQLALEMGIENKVDELTILNDSQTPVFHLLGDYKVTKEHLIPIVEETMRLASLLPAVEIRWVPREETLRADELCRAVDSEKRSFGGKIDPRIKKENPFLRYKRPSGG